MFSVLISNDGPMVMVCQFPFVEHALAFALDLHKACNVKHTVFVNNDKNENVIMLSADERKSN